MARPIEAAAETTAAVDPDDPGLFSWALAVLLWAECFVAVIAALRSGDSVAQSVGFALYATVLAVAAVARSGPLRWMRGVTFVALTAVCLAHLAPLVLGLGRRPPGPLELVLYGAALVVGTVLTVRERPLPRDQALQGWARRFEVIARAAGLGFLAGVLLMIVDVALRLPFSGH